VLQLAYGPGAGSLVFHAEQQMLEFSRRLDPLMLFNAKHAAQHASLVGEWLLAAQRVLPSRTHGPGARSCVLQGGQKMTGVQQAASLVVEWLLCLSGCYSRAAGYMVW
jgi:hypothetical protein